MLKAAKSNFTISIKRAALDLMGLQSWRLPKIIDFIAELIYWCRANSSNIYGTFWLYALITKPTFNIIDTSHCGRAKQDYNAK